MKKYLFIPFFAIAALIAGCDELIPDVDEIVSETFDFTITENVAEGFTDAKPVDITEYDEYQAYAEYIEDYIITRMTYEVSDYTAPDDLYFSGNVNIFGEDSAGYQTLGVIESINLADIAALAEEQEIAVDSAIAVQLGNWLKEGGTFEVQVEYDFETAEGDSYDFAEEDFGSGFKLTTHVYMTMVTGGGDDFEIDLGI